MGETQQPSVGQVEREISQRIQSLYKANLGHWPDRVTCQLFDTKLAIVIENSVTQPEQLLVKDGQMELAQQVRDDLDKALTPKIRQLIADILQVKVTDIMSDATLETGRTGMIVVLSDIPKVRNRTEIPKIGKR